MAFSFKNALTRKKDTFNKKTPIFNIGFYFSNQRFVKQKQIKLHQHFQSHILYDIEAFYNLKFTISIPHLKISQIDLFRIILRIAMHNLSSTEMFFFNTYSMLSQWLHIEPFHFGVFRITCVQNDCSRIYLTPAVIICS